MKAEATQLARVLQPGEQLPAGANSGWCAANGYASGVVQSECKDHDFAISNVRWSQSDASVPGYVRSGVTATASVTNKCAVPWDASVTMTFLFDDGTTNDLKVEGIGRGCNLLAARPYPFRWTQFFNGRVVKLLTVKIAEYKREPDGGGKFRMPEACGLPF